jgi:iron complex transport system substrate-binding protein
MVLSPARLLSAVLAATAVLTSACAGSPPAANPAATSGFPVTVTSCARDTTYAEAPKKAVANDINMVEMMLALDLTDRMAGITGVNGRDEVRADLRERYDRVRVISPKYVEREPLLGAQADFLFAGWNYGLSEANHLTPDTLAEHKISVYELTESCAHVIKDKKAPTLDEVATDLTNLGKIFGVPDRAAALVAQQQATLTEVGNRVAGKKPVSVFVYDGGEDAPFTAPGLAIPNELIRLAGGANVFADDRRTWAEVSWEQVVARNPECVVIVDYGETTWQQKKDFMRNNPALNKITAVRDDCFLALPYAAMTPGVRSADAVRQIAGLLHPESGR